MVKVNTKYQEKTVTARSVGCLGSNENKPIRKVDFVKNAQSVDNVSKSTHKFDPMAIISEQSLKHNKQILLIIFIFSNIFIYFCRWWRYCPVCYEFSFGIV